MQKSLKEYFQNLLLHSCTEAFFIMLRHLIYIDIYIFIYKEGFESFLDHPAQHPARKLDLPRAATCPGHTNRCVSFIHIPVGLSVFIAFWASNLSTLPARVDGVRSIEETKCISAMRVTARR